MMVDARRSAHGGIRVSTMCRLAGVVLGVGIATAAGHGVAAADSGNVPSQSDSPSHSTSGPGLGLKRLAATAHRVHHVDSTDEQPANESLTSAAPQGDSGAPRWGRKVHGSVVAARSSAPVATSAPARLASPLSIFRTRSGLGKPTVSPFGKAAVNAPAVAFAAIVTPTIAPSPPEPLSPFAKLAAVPGRVVNAVLQVLDITVSSRGPQSPINLAPIDEALFAAFRRVEHVVGLDQPVVTPPLETVDYPDPTGTPADIPTPTVSQFLNAAAAQYVLGGTPDGLVPFTVDGKQMTTRNPISGAVGSAWVTPQGQIIIAYQGTTGGTNLLFHPAIAGTQLGTDLQLIFTDKTPQAFTDSLTFANDVRAEAAAQGYSDSDIFVTGHSLGGWEAQYVAQQTGLGGIGFEGPGFYDTVPGDDNGLDSGFVNVETYGDPAAYLASDLPGLPQPFAPPYVPGGGSKPHYGAIILIGDPNATTPPVNASSLWGTGLVGDVIFGVDFLGNFFGHHLPGMQAYNLDVSPDPGVVPWLGETAGTINEGWGELTIPQLEYAASQQGVLIKP